MNTKILFLPLIIIFLVQNFVFAQNNYRTLVYEGNQKFKAKDYDKASSKYAEAVTKDPDDFAAHYNLANALYKSEKYEDAKSEYAKAEKFAKSLDDKAAALHNLGNAHMKLNDNEKAAEAYKKSLKQKPYSEATRKNYEIAMLKQKEKERNKNQDSSSRKSGGGDNKNKGKEGENKNKEQNQGNGKQNQGTGKNPKDEKDADGQGNLSKEDQKRLLNHIGDREKETARRILNDKSYSMPESNEKDW